MSSRLAQLLAQDSELVMALGEEEDEDDEAAMQSAREGKNVFLNLLSTVSPTESFPVARASSALQPDVTWDQAQEAG